jgi:polyhydroxyalkanoate synthesis regulator phasin
VSPTYLETSARMEQAWYEAGKQALQSNIAMGRRLIALKEAGSQFARFFSADLRDMRISKTRAYSLIQLVTVVDQWISNGWIGDESYLSDQMAEPINAAVQADERIQRQLCEAISDGQIITKSGIRVLEQESCAEHSDLLPAFIRARVVDRALPAKAVASLAVLLAQLDPRNCQLITSALPAKATPDDIKQASWTARQLITISSSGPGLSALESCCSGDTFQRAMHQALGLDAAGLLADAIKNASEVEAAARKLQRHRKRLSSVANRLAVECIDVHDLRAAVQALQALADQPLQEAS